MLQLIHYGLEVGLGVFDRATSMNRPHKRHMVFLGGLNQATYDGGFVAGIILTPLGTVIGVVLRTIDVDVHLVFAVELKLALAVSITPRVAVETLDDTTLCASWIVANLHRHDVGLRQDLQ